MIKRYDRRTLKKNIIAKLITGVFAVATSIVGFILIENNDAFNKLFIQIILACIFIAGLSVLVLISKDLRKIEIEKNYEQIEKYISECHNYIAMLYKMYLNNEIITKLIEKNIQLFSNYPIIYEDEYVVEIINNDKKLIIEFYEEKVMYTVLKMDKYEFDINEEKWNKISNIKFSSEEQIIDFIIEKYKHIA